MVARLTELRDDGGDLTHMMCCICFEYTKVDELWVDDEGQTWDMCKGCGLAEQVIARLRERTFTDTDLAAPPGDHHE